MQITRTHLQRFCTKNLEDYHDLYVQSNTLLLIYVFENFQNMSLEIYELDGAHFFWTRIIMISSFIKD